MTAQLRDHTTCSRGWRASSDAIASGKICVRPSGSADAHAALSVYGVIFFLLEKLAAVVGISNLHVYAAMRGQSLAEFQQTRNVPGALYSVAAGAANAPRQGTPAD
jgi:hypothetical protein